MQTTLVSTKRICFVLLLIATITLRVNAQSNQTSIPKDTLIKAAKEIMQATHFCALASVDSTGQPHVRTMNPFPIEDDMVVWFATSRTSMKVNELKNNPKVSVYFADHTNAKGYVTIMGTATVIDDKELLVKMKREYWNGIPNWKDIFVLIKIKPVRMDVINYGRGVSNDPVTSKAPSVVF